ncbi:50S ribosomal protein L4 [Sediminispirochaeta smaragdinae]|jgi:large subunit ribosomal protein L4|uniref:Large ribosomal subunit protein uL4 n=1 Tax=Sediminispirochaeta smaragdinae (strain DSM 11293 / JCM 15392 / SEBR 4228) TaxID=573413 RepID=E1RCL0_SEDSS|nr:50S ribosomal protein L4 [Sediminispirochaeta smaragdinae]ADK80090.1 ribosomal protein L4/L1e [Sediminispirochaeta smaragdinae DSM 11293]
MDAKVFSIKGEEVRTIALNDSVFGREVSEGAIYYAVNSELANRRVGTACTKTRAEVKGSNSKPWRQKGTGHARSGDKKSPVWVGGGTIFGPKPRDYGFRLPKKMKRLAMKSVLSLKAKEDAIKVVEDFTVESGKTKDLVGILKALVPEKRTVVVLKDDDAMIRRAGKNIPWVRMLSYNRMSVRELFYGKNIVLLETAAGSLNDFYGDKA